MAKSEHISLVTTLLSKKSQYGSIYFTSCIVDDVKIEVATYDANSKLKMYGAKKPSKRESVTKDQLTHHTISTYPDAYWQQLGYWNVVSIDPGIVNCGIRIERRYLATGAVETLHMDRKQFDSNASHIYSRFMEWLNSYSEIFKQSHIFIVERQLPDNYQSTRVSQHIITQILLMTVGSGSEIQPLVVEIDPKAKYKQLGAPTNLNKVALKQWGTAYAKEILKSRSDLETIRYIEGMRGSSNQKKQDDLCDTIVQIEAFFAIWYSQG